MRSKIVFSSVVMVYAVYHFMSINHLHVTFNQLAFGYGYLVAVIALCLGLYDAITNGGHGMYNVKHSVTLDVPKPQVITRDGWV